MIWWSAFNHTKHVLWLERKRSAALKAVKEAGRNCQVLGVENHVIVQERKDLYHGLEQLSQHCLRLNLRATYQQVFAFSVKAGNPFQQCYWSDVDAKIEGIQWAMEKELLEIDTIAIPPGKFHFFEKDGDSALFGKDVYKKFKLVRADIKSAGNCLAFGLETAAVFHLMRVAEAGLHALAKHLGIATIGKKNSPIEYRMWGEIIEFIQKNLGSLVQGSSESEKKEKSQFYHGVLIQCEAIKELWRNPVSHSAKIYDEGEAMQAFGHVKELMNRLATKLKA